MSDQTLVLSPTAEPIVRKKKLSPRISDLNGSVVGFLWNGKPNGNILLEKIEEILCKKFRFTKILRRRKEDVSSGAYKDLMNDLLANCDLVINAVGDCGSCSLWLILDSVRLEKKGIPTVSLCTDEFFELGKLVAGGHGVPNLPIVVVPHPVGGLKREEVESKIDDRVINEVVDAFTNRR